MCAPLGKNGTRNARQVKRCVGGGRGAETWKRKGQGIIVSAMNGLIKRMKSEPGRGSGCGGRKADKAVSLRKGPVIIGKKVEKGVAVDNLMPGYRKRVSTWSTKAKEEV